MLIGSFEKRYGVSERLNNEYNVDLDTNATSCRQVQAQSLGQDKGNTFCLHQK